MELAVKYKNFPALHCDIFDTELGTKYYDLVQLNYQQQFPIYRDRLKFTPQYLGELADQVNKHFDWSWDTSNLTLENTTRMHKDIERLVGKDFDSVPEHLDNIVHDLHYGLHLLQDDTEPSRLGWMQIEWYNDSGFDSDDVEFSTSMSVGDLKLQNPFVGHGPLQIYLENDYENIAQTCKFHTFVKPGINIATIDYEQFTDIDKLKSSFVKHAPKFVEQHGLDKIERYTGYPIVGQVSNIDLLNKFLSYPVPLELESLKFN